MKKYLILMGVFLLFIPLVNAKNTNITVGIKNATTLKKTIKKKKVKKYSKKEAKKYAYKLVLKYGWTVNDYNALVILWNRESNWNMYAVNKRSGACGIPQSLPCKKMKSMGKDYKTNYKTQIKWGLKYIKNRYGSPQNALHYSNIKGWY